MPKGNKLAYLNSPLVDTSPVDKDENAVLCKYALDIFNSKLPDLHNTEEVQNAIDNYFNNCISKGLRPGNLGLYASLGLDKREVHDLLHGRIKIASPAVIGLIKKACKAMATYREMLGATGKLSPPVLIFWQKNFDNLEDVQKIDIDANSAPKPELTPDEIAEKIEKDIPIDAEFTELS